MTAVTWSDEIHDVLTGDLTVAVSYGTPAGGAIVTAVSPVGAVDRSRGWLDTDGGTARYAPHTLKKLNTPPSKFLQSLGNGVLAKHGYRRARRTGQLHRLETLAGQRDPGDGTPTLVQTGQEPEPS